MSNAVLFGVELATYLFAFGLTFLSGYLVYRQRLAAFQIIRDFVLGVYVLIVILMALDFARITFESPSLMAIYPALSTPVSLAQAVLLLAAAIATYLRPMDSNLKSFPSLLRKAWKHALLFISFLTIAIVAVLYTLFGSPPYIVRAVDIAGRPVDAMGVAPDSIYLILVLLGFFLGYPTLILFLAARRIQNPFLRRSLMLLPIGWAFVSTVYVLFESYLWIYGVDATAGLYAINAITFFFVTREFRSASVLGGMLETSTSARTPSTKSSVPIGRSLAFLRGTACLVEVNPATSYDIMLRDIADEFLSLNDAVFVITSKGSPVHQAVSDLDQIKLLTMTSAVNYLAPTDKPGEFLIPSQNVPLLLDSFDKAVKAAATSVALIFDSLSDMMLCDGFEETYGFVKQTLEICTSRKVTFVATVFQNTHEPSALNAMRSLFSNHLVEDAAMGLRLVRFQKGSSGELPRSEEDESSND